MISSSEQTIITDENIKSLVNTYITNKTTLPLDLQNKQIGSWDVSRVTNMTELFTGYENFNESLTGWIVDNVTDMSGMFQKCSNFNQPLNDWVVNNVTDMQYMFNKCTNFNEALFKLNDGNKVSNMSGMFQNCSNFNQPLNDWKVNNVTDMEYMFNKCTNFNEALNDWVVNEVTNMGYMFNKCIKFNQPLNKWVVNNVTNMKCMFQYCIKFNKPLNNWIINPTTDTTNMFTNCGIQNRNKPGISRMIWVKPATNPENPGIDEYNPSDECLFCTTELGTEQAIVKPDCSCKTTFIHNDCFYKYCKSASDDKAITCPTCRKILPNYCEYVKAFKNQALGNPFSEYLLPIYNNQEPAEDDYYGGKRRRPKSNKRTRKTRKTRKTLK